ncbi:MAG: flagellar hook-basal body complex protein [Magnetospirillum sp.]|nr:flagellar hook-basal body complex protein [Magnetospirillum sp.]
MSLYGALFSGVSGLAAQSSAMGAISDNITNVNTIGYKGSKVNFSTLVTKQVSLTNYSPGGVQSKPRHGIDVQGLLQASSSSTDVSLSGQGFFVVNEAAEPADGDLFAYTRAGSFKVDKEGYLQNVSGWYMQGWPLMNWDNATQAVQVPVGNDIFMKSYKDTDGNTVYINDNIVSSDHLKALNLNEISGTASQTRNIRMGANLPSGDAVGDTHQTNVLIYDSLGNDNNISMYWQKTAQNAWDLEVQPPYGAKKLDVYDTTGNLYGSMGRLDFMDEPDAGAVTMTLNGTTWTFNVGDGNSGSTANSIYTDPSLTSTVGDYVTNFASEINKAYQMTYASQAQTLVPTGAAAPATFTTGTGVTITAGGVDYTYSGAGLSPAATAAAINAGTASHGMTATWAAGARTMTLTNGGASSVSVVGSGDLWELGGTIAAAGTDVTSAIDVYAASTIVLDNPATTLTLTGLTLAGAVNYINNNTATTKVTAFNNGGQMVLYTGEAETNNLTATGDALGFNGTQIVGTGLTYAERISGTNSLVFRQYDTGATDDLTVAGLTSMTTNGTKILEQAWDVTSPATFTLANLDLATSTTNAINFNGDGTPASINVASFNIDWANGSEDMSGTDEIGVFLGNPDVSDGMTQLSGDYQIGYLSQNGAKFGNFAGVSINNTGIVTALFDNGVTRPVFMIPVATFVNPNGMESLSGNVFIETDFSGQPTLREGGDGGAAGVQSASLEASTVDIGEEFTTMIVTQRAYSAAAKIITTADEMLDELVHIKR